MVLARHPVSPASLGAVLASSLVLVAALARGQAQPWSGDAKNTATAQSLFDEARAEMLEGKFVSACPKLEEAARLEPSGVGVKVKLAECYEGARRLASAYAMYAVAESAARSANQSERALWARDKAAELKPKRSSLTLIIDEHAGDTPGFTVRRDGALVGRAQWGVAIPVDGGHIQIVAEAPGRVTLSQTVEVLDEADAVTLSIGPLAIPVPTEAPAAPVAPLTSAVVEPPPAVTLPPRPAEADANAGRRVPTWAWVTGGLGLASGLAGIAFRIDGAVVEGEQSDACGPNRDRCPHDYDVEGTNTRKVVDFGLFVGLGSAGAVAVGAAVIGAIVGVPRRTPSAVSSVLVTPSREGLMLGWRGAIQ